MNKLEQLRQITIIVADTGDIESIRKYHPSDTTTNPSLLLKVAQLPQYRNLIDSAIDYGKSKSTIPEKCIKYTIDRLFVNFGSEILNIVPGRVSTEVDSRLSFDTKATIKRSRELINLYQSIGVDPNRILIKIASTWEGIKAATQLEKDGIHCNMTLLFSLAQAVLCADADVTLISPFVGRITDWHKKNRGVDQFEAKEDPGVKSVNSIYHYYKRHGYKTKIMGASFRNKEQILELAGCDLLTISPDLMEELKNTEGDVPRKLDFTDSEIIGADRISLDEKKFRWRLNEDAMATEKLAEGIRNFTKDTIKLEQYIKEFLTN